VVGGAIFASRVMITMHVSHRGSLVITHWRGKKSTKGIITETFNTTAAAPAISRTISMMPMKQSGTATGAEAEDELGVVVRVVVRVADAAIIVGNRAMIITSDDILLPTTSILQSMWTIMARVHLQRTISTATDLARLRAKAESRTSIIQASASRSQFAHIVQSKTLTGMVMQTTLN
jgi:hypothetical protein